MDYFMFYCFGFASCGFLAGACFLAYHAELQRWLTTNGPDVQVFENGDGTTTAVVQVN